MTTNKQKSAAKETFQSTKKIFMLERTRILVQIILTVKYRQKHQRAQRLHIHIGHLKRNVCYFKDPRKVTRYKIIKK